MFQVEQNVLMRHSVEGFGKVSKHHVRTNSWLYQGSEPINALTPIVESGMRVSSGNGVGKV